MRRRPATKINRCSTWIRLGVDDLIDRSPPSLLESGARFLPTAEVVGDRYPPGGHPLLPGRPHLGRRDRRLNRPGALRPRSSARTCWAMARRVVQRAGMERQ